MCFNVPLLLISWGEKEEKEQTWEKLEPKEMEQGYGHFNREHGK